MTTQPDLQLPEPVLSPDGLRFWDGQQWQLLPGPKCAWDGHRWHAKPEGVESRWTGSSWAVRPTGVESQWDGTGWVVKPAGVESNWDGLRWAIKPEGVESHWHAMAWQARPTRGRSEWNGQEWVTCPEGGDHEWDGVRWVARPRPGWRGDHVWNGRRWALRRSPRYKRTLAVAAGATLATLGGIVVADIVGARDATLGLQEQVEQYSTAVINRDAAAYRAITGSQGTWLPDQAITDSTTKLTGSSWTRGQEAVQIAFMAGDKVLFTETLPLVQEQRGILLHHTQAAIAPTARHVTISGRYLSEVDNPRVNGVRVTKDLDAQQWLAMPGVYRFTADADGFYAALDKKVTLTDQPTAVLFTTDEDASALSAARAQAEAAARARARSCVAQGNAEDSDHFKGACVDWNASNLTYDGATDTVMGNYYGSDFDPADVTDYQVVDDSAAWQQDSCGAVDTEITSDTAEFMVSCGFGIDGLLVYWPTDHDPSYAEADDIIKEIWSETVTYSGTDSLTYRITVDRNGKVLSVK